MRRPLPVAYATALVAGLVLTGCGMDSGSSATGSSASAAASKPQLKVGGAFIPAPPTDAMAAGFFTVTNSGGSDTLTSVTSDLAGQVTLHSSNGGAMEEKSSLPVPAHGTLDFARGGNHVMFEKLTHKPKQGETVSVKLHFAESGPITVEVPVRAATYHPSSSTQHS